MGKSTLKDPAAVVRGIASNSGAYQKYTSAKKRRTELLKEKRALESRVDELADSDLDGLNVVQRGGMRMVETSPKQFLEVEAWRRRREEERRAAAVLEGTDPGADSHQAAEEELASALERIQAIEDALPLSRERIEEASRAAQREMRTALQDAYGEQVAKPLLDVFESLAERAERHAEFSDALVHLGFSRNAVQGFRADSYRDNPGTRGRVAIEDLRELLDK